jgi:hypothetical protein
LENGRIRRTQSYDYCIACRFVGIDARILGLNDNKRRFGSLVVSSHPALKRVASEMRHLRAREHA